MGFFDTKKIEFKAPFSDKYRLSITSNIQTGNMPIESKAEIRWEVKVKSIGNQINIEVITLDNQLVSCNNPIVKNMADMNQIFARMYSELDLTVSNDYKLVNIKNRELIIEKWGWIKSELEKMLEEEPQLVSQVINLNEAQFSDPNAIVSAIQKNEFFMIYFHHLYGSGFHSVSNKVKSKNIFNTALLEWVYRIDKAKEINGQYNVFNVEGHLETNLNQNWVKEFYKGFSHLDLEKIKPEITERGEYCIDIKSGKILNATLEKKEIAHPQLLHATIHYDLQLEKSVEYRPTTLSQEGTEKQFDEKEDLTHSFILDD